MLVDDHRAVMAGSERLFADAGIETVAKVADPGKALEAFDKYRPDVVVLDIRFGEGLLSGVEVARQLLDLCKDAKIVVFSQSNDFATIQACFQAGVLGFLTKDCDPEELEKAIRKAISGEQYLGEQVSHQLIEHMNKPQPKPEMFTEQELEIVRYVCEGKTLRQIGDIFGHSNRWAHDAVKKIKIKLSVTETADLIRVAVQTNLLRTNDDQIR